MTFEAIYLGKYRCEPGPARTYAQELRELGKAAGETEDAYAVGLNLDRREFEGEAGDSFRAQCKARMLAAAELRANMGHLSEAAGEAARDAHDIAILLDEMVAIAHTGGLVVSSDAIHPPDNAVRREDTPALVQGWRAWDQLTSRRAAVDASYHQSIDDWVQAIAHYGYSEWARDSVPAGAWIPDTHHDKGDGLPENPVMHDRIAPVEVPSQVAAALLGRHEGGRFDSDSRAQWIEGHRNKLGEWVHAHWQPFGPDGHGTIIFATDNPHAGEHSSGATRARWVDGRWEPVVPDRPPSVVRPLAGS
ncbi:hypothetical protein [Nocardioides sp. InS609-2]|uniref:hypothetical protein n=1 Tax=Nocardioides sp. InS609-2 TaxID=2760705 RepID=UPI0020BEB9BC|nr:hypothetical protein [Nocardioides sp. InS609-2]